MSCGICGNDFALCEKYDQFVCEDCYDSMIDDECIDCEYKDDCEIYNSESVDIEGYLNKLKNCDNHVKADKILIDLLTDLGYNDIVKAWHEVTSYYR